MVRYSIDTGMYTVLLDLRYACRALLRSPAFTAIVVVTLALGIGASLAMFSLMLGVLWRPLPYPDPGRIVSLEVDARSVRNTGATLGEVLDLKDRARSFDRVATIDSGDADLEESGQSERVNVATVSDDLLPLLGVRPALGVALESAIHSGPEHASAVLIGDELWRRRFASDPAVIGRAIRLDGVEMRIAGVLPAGFRLLLPPSMSALEKIDVWLPYALHATRRFRGVPVLARLRPGITLGQANSELQSLAAQFEREHPDYYSGDQGWQASPADLGPGPKVRFTASLLHDQMTRDARPSLYLLSCAVAFVLLIACVNVANLTLARGAARHRELAVRRALGAARGRLLRFLFTESLLLAAIASALGLLGAHFGIAAITRLNASYLPLQSRISLDPTVSAFALILAFVTSVLFGFLPSWRLASGETELPPGATRTGTASSGARRVQRTLVVAEIALSIVPLACGGLMLRSFLNLLHSPLGFNPDHVVTATVRFDPKRYPSLELRWAWMRDLLARVRAIPGVQSASAVNHLPLAGQEFRRVGRADQPDAAPILATQQISVPQYLAAIGTPLLAGRDFTDDDVSAQRAVTIIDQRLARRLWPEGAIGKRLSVYRTGRRNDMEIVGVIAALRATRIRDDNVPHFLMPYGEYPPEMSLVIQSPAAWQELVPAINAAVEAAHGGRAAFDIRPMTAYVSDSIGDTRFILFVLAVFAAASIVLAAVGLYGTLAYLTAQRTREFGIRLALGSSLSSILAIVLREGVLLATAGAILGLTGSAAVTGLLGDLLYQVPPLDIVTLVSVVSLVSIVSVAAAAVPAWRATRIDPQISMRAE